MTKYVDWQYEKEWRIIGTKGLCIYSAEHIDRIIFRVKMPNSHRSKIFNILADKKVNFFEAVKSKRHFSIEIKPIDK